MTDLAALEAARRRLSGNVRETPLLFAPALDAQVGRRILVKPECLQVTGSFKARGAWSAISALAPEVRQRGILAYSSGNHAQGIAWAALRHGVPATIVMPSDAPAAKVAGTRGYGGEVVFYDRAQESREEIGQALARERGLTLIQPYDHPDVIAGQGSVGLEIAEQSSALGVSEADVLVCCGGGGLSAGISLALSAKAPGLRVRPVEPVGFDDMARSLVAGTRQTNAATSGSICDAILTPKPGELTFPILKDRSGPGLLVSDDEALQAMAVAFRHLKIVAEPGGAVALAAALFRASEVKGDAVIVVVSGGNVDPALFARALATL
ncbi:MAG: threonine/serine dehydratase [Pseudomonadota bacterium]